MSQRIGLFTELGTPNKRSARTTSASYVDIENAKDLADKLVGLGAKKFGLLRRDRLGETHLEGAMLAPTEVKDDHLKWLTAKPDQFETRGVYYTK
jgi:hypothetical protein